MGGLSTSNMEVGGSPSFTLGMEYGICSPETSCIKEREFEDFVHP